jgi:teichuronic acid biosynthesis glycosyltransferase TuaH
LSGVGVVGDSHEWDGLIVLCAGNNWDGVKLHDQHMAECLTEHAPVLYVDPPMSHLTPLKQPHLKGALRKPHLRMVAPRLARLTPVMPPRGQRRAVVPLTNRLVRRSIAKAVEQLGGRVRAVVTAWILLDVYGACGESERVYWWQDDPGGAAEFWGFDRKRLLAGERRLGEQSSTLIVSNPAAVELWERRGCHSPILIPYGCDAERFAATDDAPPAKDVHLPAPIAGFVGHLNARTDLRLLEAVADSGTSLLLIGPRDPHFEPQRVDRLFARPSVSWLGPRPFESLPSYLRLVDVGLVPYHVGNTFNQWSFPLKTLEYLAAGRPVVATPLPATIWLDTDLITCTDDPSAFAASVTAAAERAHIPAEIHRRREFAAEHSWRGRATRFAAAVGAKSASPPLRVRDTD